MVVQNVPVGDHFQRGEEFNLFGLEPNFSTAPATSSAAALEPFVFEASILPTAPGGSPSGVERLEKKTQLPFLSVANSHCNRTSRCSRTTAATMLRRMDLEEKRRNQAKEKVAKTAKAAKKAAEAALTQDPFDLRAAALSVDQ